MLTAVWVAVIIAAAFWVVGVCAAVYLLIKLARLASQASSAVADLRERGELAIGRANAAVDRAGEQIVKADAITASMDEVTANMAELTDRVTSLAPLARVIASSAGTPLARVSALVYGVRRAAHLRRNDHSRAGHGARGDRAGRAGRRAYAGPAARVAAQALERGLASRQREEAGR
ncbi:MAG: hypothetical protein QOJ73_3645 [Streptosporangiaceae bacterium]|jgi:G3E family GTPase|nr:hypothetical protein [Streptosporangiaceae bacterium]